MKPADRYRTEELAKIHIAKKDLSLPDDVYRAMISTVSGGKTESSAKLTWRGRRDLLEMFKEKGWQPRHAGAPPVSRPSRPLADFPEAKMIRGLWIELSQMYQLGAEGAVKNASEKALNGFVKRMTGVEDLHWLRRKGRVDHVIEALKKWLARSRLELFDAWWQSAHPERQLNSILLAGVHDAVRALEPWTDLNEDFQAQMHPAIYAVMSEYTTAIRERRK